MFKLKFANTYANSVYLKYNVEPVVEDYFLANEKSFVVADGVTKDLITGEATGYPTTVERINYILNNYPNPSGSYLAASIVCDSFIQCISSLKENEISEEKIKEILVSINNKLKDINEGRKIDYLANDLHSTVAAGGIIVENLLYCFAIGDSHVTLLDENLNIVFTTYDPVIFFEEYITGFDWNKQEYRVMSRKKFRNNHYVVNDKDISYGVLNGQDMAKDYIYTYKIDLKNVKYICAYSDGCEPNFKNKENISQVINNTESIKNSGKEKTLLIYENID